MTRMARARRWARATFPKTVALAVALQAFFLVALAATDGYDVARSGEAARVVLTFATVVALFVLVDQLGAGSRQVGRALTSAVFVLFVTLNFVRFETAGAFDYGFAHENIREMATASGWSFVTANVRLVEVGFLWAVPLAVALVAAWKVAGRDEPRRFHPAIVAACIAFLVGAPAARVATHESLTSFAASALRFHAEASAAEGEAVGRVYPYVRTFAPSARARALAGPADAPRPHVILLFLESWSARYTDARRPGGRPYTPVLDAKRREGLTFDHFYGNSVQSSRGHFATLCSLIPMYRGKEFLDIPDTRLNCLPKVLGDSGYRTLFVSATDEPDFEGSAAFFSRIGFAESVFQDPAARGDASSTWGAGLQDDVFYRSFFSRLDEELARANGSPIFAVAANASNHYPFDKSPDHHPGPEGTKYHRNYVASLSQADAWLATFFAELDRRPAFRDGIVVLVGDHSFPADEHGIHFNGRGAFEEAFHTSFALRWNGHVRAEVVADRAASQIDVAPTLADLLGVQHVTHFVGESLVAGTGTDARPRPTPMVQPYDGVQLVAVQYPLKLVRHEAANQEHLYDVAADPDEEHDRIADPALRPALDELRNAITRIHANEGVLRGNRVWPPAGESASAAAD